MKVLLTYAIEAEKGAITMPDHNVTLCCTGIGKVQSALAVSEAIMTERPDLVLNIGSCGSVRHPIGDILLCARFMDRDLQKVAIPEIPYELDFFEEIREAGLLPGYNLHHTVSTGDSFVVHTDDLADEADVVDMETFAIACACKRYNVPFLSVKYVTDIVGQNSVRSWAEKLSDACNGLAAFIGTIRLKA
ncbi:MAG: 5'-methylthioadenosine/S-adenosylhomocysteine nucleosidase [Bacteroidota bacterium]|nr:5'-methylthioadenosine/S-adenosylhomocysteine nucleosidase [Bacteroidota bacterium]